MYYSSFIPPGSTQKSLNPPFCADRRKRLFFASERDGEGPGFSSRRSLFRHFSSFFRWPRLVFELFVDLRRSPMSMSVSFVVVVVVLCCVGVLWPAVSSAGLSFWRVSVYLFEFLHFSFVLSLSGCPLHSLTHSLCSPAV